MFPRTNGSSQRRATLFLAAAAGCALAAACGGDDATGNGASRGGAGGSIPADSSTSTGGSTGEAGTFSGGGTGTGGAPGSGGGAPAEDSGAPDDDASEGGPVNCTVVAGANLISSPDGQIVASLAFDEATGTIAYTVKSANTTVIDASPLGIVTDLADFTTGLQLLGGSCNAINETYTLPSGKRSPYVNKASELVMKLGKNQHELDVAFRAYDDGVAFRYSIPGSGNVNISKETTSFKLSGSTINYWGEPHPNDYGNETLITAQTGTNLSTPVLAEMKDLNHWVFLAQAATYGTYVISWFQRTGQELKVQFPVEQTTPVTDTLPFASPWRVAIISSANLSKIVETTMLENLNPPTEPALQNATWIKAGRATWDFIAGDSDKPRNWIDFDAEMGWEYHILDAGWQSRVPDINAVAQYAAQKGVQLMAWGYTPSLDAADKAETFFADLEQKGIKGAKLDFFDRHSGAPSGTTTLDFEDTQTRLQTRDMLCELAAKHHLMVEFHGAALPSGERRRWPNLMSTEGVRGLEAHPPITQDCVVPLTRNIMGPVDFTLIDYKNTTGANTGTDNVRKTNAGQIALTVLLESGLQIFVPTAAYLRGLAAVDFLKRVPAAWDDTKFIEGYPNTHATIARRKGKDWFVGTIAAEARTAAIPLSFLEAGVTYNAEIYRDGATNLDILVEKKPVTRADTLSIACHTHGGAAIRLAAP
jgi:alpha-glucosidase